MEKCKRCKTVNQYSRMGKECMSGNTGILDRQNQFGAADRLIDDIHKAPRYLGREDQDRFMTGFPWLDQLVTWKKGQLVTIGARPGVGKSSFALQLGERFASAGHKVLFCTLEMSSMQLLFRAMVGRTDNTMHGLTRGVCDDLQGYRIKGAELAKLPLFLSDTVRTFGDIASAVLSVSPDVVIVDHCQLLRDDQKHYSVREEVKSLTRKLKLLAKDSNALVLALSQLSRNGSGGYPQLEDLKESGSFEEDSDIVLLLSRMDADTAIKAGVASSERVFRNMTEKQNCYPSVIDVAKNRDGETGRIKATFDGTTFLFRETGQ